MVELADGDDLAALAVEAARRGTDALGVAGGDGSLATVAAVALEHDLPFVCVPAGTMNHFALDLGLDPDDLVASLDAFTGGAERRIDTGEVNGRLFLNNVSLGVYGEAIRKEGYRDGRVRTLLSEVFRGSSGEAGLRIVDDRGDEHHDPPVILVSNNPYAVGGGRESLDGGELGVVVLPPLPAPVRAWTVRELTVFADTTVHAGIDGEAVELEPPLRIVVRPASLRVRTPG